MATKCIVEFKTKPGRRDELLAHDAKQCREMSGTVPGFQGWAFYANNDDPDMLVAIYEWASEQQRLAWRESLAPDAWSFMDDIVTDMRATFLTMLSPP